MSSRSLFLRTAAFIAASCVSVPWCLATGTRAPDVSVRPLASYFSGFHAAAVVKDAKSGSLERLNPDQCRRRFVPASTFKIPNTLIGLETAVVPDLEYRITWDGVRRPIESHNRDHTMRTAFRESAGWYYHEMARRVGVARMREWVGRLGYGNQAVSGVDVRFWHSSLLISANEQVEFLQRLHQGALPVSARSIALLKEVMRVARTDRGSLYGKTGTDGYMAGEVQIATLGWFVGWVEFGTQVRFFAANITGGTNPTGRTVREAILRLSRDRGWL